MAKFDWPAYGPTELTALEDDNDAIEAFRWEKGRYGYVAIQLSREQLEILMTGKVLAYGDSEYTTLLKLRDEDVKRG